MILMVEFDKQFISWCKRETGKYQIKLLDQAMYPLGSGILLNYRKRYFIVTCYHCVRYIDDVRDLIAPVHYPNGQVKAFNLRNPQSDPESDLASFEISYVDLSVTQNEKGYIQEVLFDELKPENNIGELIVINATNYTGYDRDEKEGLTLLRLTTLPYFTEIEEYENDFFKGNADTKGIGEDGVEYQVETFAGMSGSPSFKIDIKRNLLRWIGILTNGDPGAGSFLVLDYRLVIKFLDQKYFSK
ncbi:serine protease [Paenibacillus piscarius]|uniref:serine protease n=1 Tax=Paenibacillus piscarius TaxID=1089681 RepID=UPI001EE92C86|nr:serine protease [Paenibacillus piscarius]